MLVITITGQKKKKSCKGNESSSVVMKRGRDEKAAWRNKEIQDTIIQWLAGVKQTFTKENMTVCIVYIHKNDTISHFQSNEQTDITEQ